MLLADDDSFSIEFVRAGSKDDDSTVTPATARVPVKFRIRRGPIHFDVTVFVHVHDAVDENYIKVARHLLHLDFARLAEQTKRYRIPVAELEPRDPDGIPF